MLEGSRIRRVVVAVDGSEASAKGVSFALGFARSQGAELVAVHVVTQPIYILGFPLEGGVPLPVQTEDAKRVGERYVDVVKEMGKEVGLQVRTEVLVNYPSVVNAIVEFAAKEKVDLIIIGTRGRTGLRRFLFGSVSGGVVAYAPCHVLVVR